MNRKSLLSGVLVSLLILSTAFIAASIFVTPAAAAGRSAWLKIVTSAWKGTSCGIYDGVDSGFFGDDVGVNTPMCINPSVSGFADRFNVTGHEAFVEVYGLKPEMGLIQMQGKFDINATGFAKISWTVDDNWGLLVLVKAKSYYGVEIGKGSPFSGIIIYALAIPPRSMTAEAKEKFLNMTGLYTEWINGVFDYVGNVTINDDGLIDYHGGVGPEGGYTVGGVGDFDFNLPRAGLGSGPFDILNGTSVDLASFSRIFGNETAKGTPVNAWIARAAKMFKVFHVHSWYDLKDNLSFAQIKIYDLDHTDPTSEASLIQAAVTGEDGQSRYTREIYPSDALEYRKFWDNRLVPIPLQIFNLDNKTVYHGGIYSPGSGGAIGAPKLNATVRVWWETVIVNQTIYYGWTYNGTGTWADPDDLGKLAPGFVGPLSMALNNTVTISGTASPDGIWVDYEFEENYTNVANIINATVFYARFCVQDADLQIQHPEVGDKLVNMPVSINLKTGGDTPYYLTKNLPTTDNGGCTDDPHKYRGGLSQFDKFSRFPNATMWYALYIDLNDNGIPDYFDERGIASFWINFGKHVRLNASLAYLPGDARNYNDIPEGPNLKDVKTPSRIGDEDVKKSSYYNGNWSMLVADVKYANTLTLRDDKPYKGFDVVFKWAGGARNSYPGQEKVVDVLRIENPYSIALLYNFWDEDEFGGWVWPNTELASNKLLIKVHESERMELGIDTNGDGSDDYYPEFAEFEGTLEITGAAGFGLRDFDPTTGTFTIEVWGIDGEPFMTVNIVENKTDPWVDYTNVTYITIEGALATIKKHDITPTPLIEGELETFIVGFESGQGQADFEADGRAELTTVDTFLTGLAIPDLGEWYAGPMEVEIWPGPPGSGTIKVLVSAFYTDFAITFIEPELIGGYPIIYQPIIYWDYTGTVLLQGPPEQNSMIFGYFLVFGEYEYASADTLVDPQGSIVFTRKSGFTGPSKPTTSLPGNEPGGYDAWAASGIVSLKFNKTMKIEDLWYTGGHFSLLGLTEEGMTSLTAELYKGTFGYYDGTNNNINYYGATGTLKVTNLIGAELSSLVVPLKDDPMDDEADKWIFGGYDDFALVGTGHVYVTAFVHDIVYKVTDNLGDPLPAGQTEVDLILPNGEVVKRTPAPPELADVMTGSLQWSYKYYGEGNAVFFQLPGATGPYGVRVLYAGTEVYYKRDIINVLEVTEFITIVAKVYKVKLVFEDCQGQLMPGLYYKFTLPSGRTDWDRTSREGEVDFPYMAGGTLTIHGVWWKGVELPLMEAKFATGEKINLVDGKLVLEIGEGINAPIVITVPIKDLIFYTMDFQGEIKIPRLNITLTWMGTPKPWSTEKIYYVETLDPTGDTEDADDDGYTRNDYNTSVIIHPLWFRYDIDTFFQKIADDSPMDGMTEWEAKYVFYKMPPTIYNITVTTVNRRAYPVGHPLYMPDDEQSPGNSKWPGRDIKTPYEIKIDWKGWSEDYEDTIPSIRTTPAGEVNDRVVLRIFGSMNGVPVTTENFPGWLVEAWNPELIGIRTALVCKEEIKLKTWAHDFWKSVIDGDYRVGDASFRIQNDNEQEMIYYDLKEEKWVGNTYTSKWTEDIKDISAIMKDSHYTSNIYWNGSYLLKDLYFETNMTYSYSKGKNASFIVDKFYNASMTSDATPGADGFWSPNKVDPTLNFTLVGTENLWKTSRRFPLWKARITGNTWKDWYSAWFLVYELPKDTDEYTVLKGPDGKGLLPIPLPVAFIKLGAFAKDGTTALQGALIELWTLHMDVKNKVKISAADEGCDNLVEMEVCWEWEKKLVETSEPQIYDWKRWDRVWLSFTYGEESKTIFVQVPPPPAKLILRDIFGDESFDVAVSADYVYQLLTDDPRDNNVGVDDKWGEEDGILSYGRWYTESDGYIKSFKALGTADPRYGSIVLPIAGWLNETFHDYNTATKDEFHYQINIVWKSAVVYSDNIVLTKPGYATGPSEVYTVTFYLALSNSTKAPVKGLNAWIYYPNVTEWHSARLWKTVPPTPQDYEACEDSVFPCELRVTLASEAWADGKKTFDLIPGPRFMNTTWKYVFSANHTAIDWMDDLVATQFVLNNETFGDDGLRVKTTRIDVPIMLNAARWVVFEVATWRDEAGIPTAYPMKDYIVKYEIRKPKYLTGPALTAASGSATTDAEGKVVLTSDPSDPRKVFWAGMVVRYRVEPPTYTSDYSDAFWKDWLKAKAVDPVDKKAEYKAPAIAPIMSHAYYPDEEPTHFAIVKIETTWVNKTKDPWPAWCSGLCVHQYRSKPFIVWVDYTAVTVRVTDFNGRPLAGAFVQLWDKASGKLAAWHYTAATEWNATPLDVAGLIAWHGLDNRTDTVKIPFQNKSRTFGGAGFTGVMNVTVGPVEFDTNGDDRIDVSLPHRGVPDFPDTSYITYIARAFWLSTAEPTTIEGGKVTLKPVWPYLPNIAPKVYDSEEDEVTWKLLLPRYVAGAAFRPGMALYYPQVLNIPSAAAPTGALVKEHRDVFAHVFNLEMNLRYEGKPLAEILKKIGREEFVVRFIKAYDEVKFLRNDTIKIEELPRGTYTVIVEFKGKEVARRTIDLSTVNVGTVTADIPLAMRDVSFQVVDVHGRPLTGVTVAITPGYYADASPADIGGVLTIRGIVTTELYDFTVKFASKDYEKEASIIVRDTPDGLAERAKIGRPLELPVGDVVITVVDREGKPVGSAKITVGKVTVQTDSDGKALLERVPLETEGRGIEYEIKVERDGLTITEKVTFSRSKTTHTIIAALFSLKVRVVGAAGQGLPFAKVTIFRGPAEIGTFTTDVGGFLEVPNLPLADYKAIAEYKGFRGEATATRDDLTAGRAVEISLPPYIEIAGVPFTFSAFLGLIIGLIILVIVLVIISSEYIRWRGRRLGIYPPPPPKK